MKILFMVGFILIVGIMGSWLVGCGVSIDCEVDADCASLGGGKCVAAACRECRENADCPPSKICNLTSATCVTKHPEHSTQEPEPLLDAQEPVSSDLDEQQWPEQLPEYLLQPEITIDLSDQIGPETITECQPNQGRECYTGPPKTLNIGICRAGYQICNKSGQWGNCIGQVLPSEEICDELDNNCNGRIDEAIQRPCYSGPSQTKGIGPCGEGVQVCSAGKWSVCMGQIIPTSEICNGIDSDCNGRIDDNVVNCVTTIAGKQGVQGSSDGLGFTARFNAPSGIAVDDVGNIYISDTNNHRIRKIDIYGHVSTIAGEGVSGLKNGAAKQAQFNSPRGLAIDADGIIYVADTGNNCIRKIDKAGIVSTLAGSTIQGYRDGTGTLARFFAPLSVAIDPHGDLYVADSGNHRIRRINSSGVVSTWAGNGLARFADGPPLSASFANPQSISFDLMGMMYIADPGNFRLRTVDRFGHVSTFAGSGSSISRDGTGTAASFRSPRSVTVSYAKQIFIIDLHQVRRISDKGVVQSLTTYTSVGYRDGSLSPARFNTPLDIAVDSLGNIYIADSQNHVIRKITLNLAQTCSQEGAMRSCYSLANSPIPGTPCKLGTQSCIQGLWSLCQAQILPKPEECNGLDDDCDGQIDNNLPPGPLCDLQLGVCEGSRANCRSGKWQACVIFDYLIHNKSYSSQESCDGLDNNCNGLVDEDITDCVTTVAGNNAGYLNGDAQIARFRNPTDVAWTRVGILYVADSNNHLIRKIDDQGIVSTVAGAGIPGYQDSSSTFALFNLPMGLVALNNGDLYIADSNNHSIRKIDTKGMVSTFAGAGVAGYQDAKGAAARFNTPLGISFDDKYGVFYVADSDNHLIRKIDLSGVVTTVAGSGVAGHSDDVGTSAMFHSPTGIAIDHNDNLYIADSGNHRIRKINPNGEVTTLAGSGLAGYRDLQGLSAQFSSPNSLMYDSLSGDLYIVDTGNHSIRKLDAKGYVTTLTGFSFGYIDGPASQAKFSQPYGIALGTDNYLYIADSRNHRIRRIKIR